MPAANTACSEAQHASGADDRGVLSRAATIREAVLLPVVEQADALGQLRRSAGPCGSAALHAPGVAMRSHSRTHASGCPGRATRTSAGRPGPSAPSCRYEPISSSFLRRDLRVDRLHFGDDLRALRRIGQRVDEQLHLRPAAPASSSSCPASSRSRLVPLAAPYRDRRLDAVGSCRAESRVRAASFA